MARVAPFRALRFASLDEAARHLLPDPSRLPPGVRRALARRDERHVARLYEAADPWAALRRWADEGVVVSEPPAMYVVETAPADPLRRREPVRFVLGEMRAGSEAPPLERLWDPRASAPIEPVPVLAADDHQILRGLLGELVESSPPVFESTAGGQRLRMWRIGQSAIGRRLRAALDEVPLRPHGRVPERGPFLAAVVPLSEPGLRFEPIHRGLRGLPTFSPDRFLALVKDYARIYDLDEPLTSPTGIDAAVRKVATLSAGRHAVLAVLPGPEGRILRFLQALELDHVPAAPRSPTLRSLDLALLNALVLRTVLGIPGPESPGHPNVFQVPSVEELVAKVAEGTFQAGFALNPPPLWEVRAVMEAAQSLPPATMQLEPAPPAGLLFLDPRAMG